MTDWTGRSVVLLGSPRSGTTLLGHLFATHPEVYYANEPRLLWRYGNDRRSDALQPEHATPDVAQHIRAEFTSRLSSAQRSVLVEKTPSNCLRVGFVDAVLPGSRYIHITRNGREAVAGIYDKWMTKATGLSTTKERARLRRRLAEASPRQVAHYLPELVGRLRASGSPRPWGPRLPGMGEMVRDLPLIEVCAMQWRWSVESVHRNAPLLGDRLATVKLEELDEGTIRSLVAHAGLEGRGEDLVLAQFRGRFDQEQTAGRFEALAPELQERVDALVAPTNGVLGYA